MQRRGSPAMPVLVICMLALAGAAFYFLMKPPQVAAPETPPPAETAQPDPLLITVRVVDSNTGTGVAGVEITLEHGAAVEHQGATGPDGRCVFENVSAGEYVIQARVQEAGLLPVGPLPIPIAVSEGGEDMDIEIPVTQDTAAPENIEAATASTLSGLAVDNIGIGLPDARITLVPTLNDLAAGMAESGLPDPFSAVTRAGGAFSLSNIVPDVYEVRLNDMPARVRFPDGRVLDSLNLLEPVTWSDLRVFFLVPGQSPPNLSGTVISPKRTPLPNVEVKIYRDDSGLYEDAATDSLGAFQVYVDPGPYEIIVAAQEGFASVPVDVPAEDVTVQLAPYMVVEGTVLDTSGSPVADARLSTDTSPERETDDRLETLNPDFGLCVTDDAGRFTMRFGQPGTYETQAKDADTLLFGTSGPYTIAPDTATPPLVIVLGDGSTISGRVLDELGMAVPLAHVEIQAVGREEERVFRQSGADKMAVSDNTGAYMLERLPACEYLLTASLDGYGGSTEVRVPLGEDEDAAGIDIVLLAGGSLHGRVNLGGASMPREVFILASGEQRSAELDERGEFLEENLPPGPCMAVLQIGDPDSAEGLNRTVARQATIQPGMTAEVVFDLNSSTRVSGTVTAPTTMEDDVFVIRLAPPGANPMIPNEGSERTEALSMESAGFAAVERDIGTFEIIDVEPGEYDLMVYGGSADKQTGPDGARVKEFGPVFQQHIRVPTNGLEVDVRIP